MSSGSRLVEGLEDVAPLFDGFVLDQYGVLHDGEKSLPGVPQAIAELKRLGKKLVVLSNTSKTFEAALARLPALGLDPADFEGAVTGGTEALLYVQAEAKVGGTLRGNRCVCFTWQGDWHRSYFRSGGLEIADVESCDFLFANGCDCILSGEEPVVTTFGTDGQLSANYSGILARAAERGLPMVCSNPDLSLVMPDGSFGHMPGVIAEEYQRLGGEVRYFGKPHASHFHKAVAMLGLDPSKVIHVGDSVTHDIAGASGAGLQSLFVCGGIHRAELYPSGGEAQVLPLPSEELLQNVFQRHGVEATFTVPTFQFRTDVSARGADERADVS